jgi:Tfp pilus assembly protein PilO
VSARTWRIGGVLAAVLLLVVAWFALVSPTRQAAAALQEETVSQQAASDQLRSRISLLKKQSEELPAQEAKLASIQQRMPSDAALPTLIRNLTTVAQAANVTVASVTPGRPTPIAEPTPPPAPATPDAAAEGEDAEGEDAEGEDGEEAPDPAQDAASSDASGGTGGPAGSVGPTVQAVSLNITACGTFAQLRSYLRELEQMPRVVSVHGLQISRGACGEGSSESDLTATVQASVFTMQMPQADAGTTTSAAGQPAATAGEGEQS